jgi:glyoxylase-like metal-dependent hydrolase (beta-lactamase superfamily II)
MDYRVISIGALSRHELWGETTASRTAHATTTLIRSEDRVILVDPGLPAPVIVSRLQERAGVKAAGVTDVFLTCFRPAHRWGLAAFPHARWWISEAERETVGGSLVARLRGAQEPEECKVLEEEISLLQRCQPAPDRLAPQVDLFPLPGYTPGTCGLLLKLFNSTGLVAGDAVVTAEHLEQGRVLRDCYDTKQARESFLEAVEIADLIIPGHDNLLMNPARNPF